jgi:hypothetical protein
LVDVGPFVGVLDDQRVGGVEEEAVAVGGEGARLVGVDRGGQITIGDRAGNRGVAKSTGAGRVAGGAEEFVGVGGVELDL